MQLHFELLSTLPPLAWAALVARGQNVVRVLAGEDVVREDRIFWEGLSLSPENPGAVLNHPLPLSTGGLARNDDIVFWTPGHFLDRLFIVESDTEVIVSNSLPFVLRVSGSKLLADHLHYPWHFGRITAHCQSAPLTRGRVLIVSNANVSIARTGAIEVAAKVAPPAFDDYRSYIGQVHAFLDEVAEANLRQAGPRYRYLATLSSGYDSPAATALGKRIGLAHAISITDSRSGVPGDDSGELIASAMGIALKTAARKDYQSAGWKAERLFYVFGLPEDIGIYPFRADLKRSLLFTGIQGETMWDINPHYSSGAWSWDPGGATMQEFRLRAGFANLPPAFFGWQHNERLLGIGRSAELKPWSVGTSYDRPIARRLVEECGVPRVAFGMKKRAVSVMVGIHNHGYIATDDIGVSPEMTKRLAEHAQAAVGLKCKTELALCNGMHNVVRILHESAHSLQKRTDQSSPTSRKSERLAWKTMFLADRALPIRRKFMAPFSMLNFSTQVANESLAEDYAAFKV